MTKYTDMLKEVYLYEMEKNIPESDRMVSYIPELCMYQGNVTNDEIRSRYSKIVNEKNEAERKLQEEQESTGEYSGSIDEKTEEINIPKKDEPLPETVLVQRTLNLRDSKVIVVKLMEGHNDKSTYSYKNIKNAIHSYMGIQSDKAIGYTYEGKDYYVLLKKQTEYSKLQQCSEGQEFFYNYYAELLSDSVKKEEELQIKEKTEAENARIRAEELRINPKFKKDFVKLLKGCRDKLVRGKNFEAYDFRGIEIKDIVFMDCNFDFANFTDTSIDNVVFVRCSMEDVIKEGTKFDNVDMIQCRCNKENNVVNN